MKRKKQGEIYIGVDVGGTKILAAAATVSGKIIGRVRCSTPRKVKPKKVIKAVIDAVDTLLNETAIDHKCLKGLGIALPGVVDPQQGKVLVTPNMGLSGIVITTPLRKYFGVPVHIGNDVNMGVLGEHWLGVCRKVKTCVGIFVGTGIGGGIINEGSLLYGSHNAAAEIGHMIMIVDGPRCGCGNRGCLEAIAGRAGIERSIRAAVKSGRKSVVTDLLDGDLSVIKSKILRKALNKNDSLIKEVMKNAAVYLGHACISIKHLYDPEMIVLGGGVIEACGDFIVPIVRKIVSEDPFLSKESSCRVVTAQLGDDAVVIGAIALAGMTH